MGRAWTFPAGGLAARLTAKAHNDRLREAASVPIACSGPSSAPVFSLRSGMLQTRPVATIITCTGDRPQAFRLCERWMSRQRFAGGRSPFVEWLVVDDGSDPTATTLGQTYIRREPREDDPAHTMGLNLLAALERVTSDKIVIVEDDDFYSERYLDTVIQLLDRRAVVAQTGTRLYNVRHRAWKFLPNAAAFFVMAFGKSMIPLLRDAIQRSKVGDVDVVFGSLLGDEAKVFRYQTGDVRDAIAVGIKGLPGRRGITSGHGFFADFAPDPTGAKLREWIGDNANVYAPFYAPHAPPLPMNGALRAALRRNAGDFAATVARMVQGAPAPEILDVAQAVHVVWRLAGGSAFIAEMYEIGGIYFRKSHCFEVAEDGRRLYAAMADVLFAKGLEHIDVIGLPRPVGRHEQFLLTAR